MTPPTIRHSRWCSEPPLRRSDSLLERGVVTWRCPECGARATVIGGEDR